MVGESGVKCAFDANSKWANSNKGGEIRCQSAADEKENDEPVKLLRKTLEWLSNFQRALGLEDIWNYKPRRAANQTLPLLFNCVASSRSIQFNATCTALTSSRLHISEMQTMLDYSLCINRGWRRNAFAWDAIWFAYLQLSESRECIQRSDTVISCCCGTNASWEWDILHLHHLVI